ncbi:membrane-associated, metal-dependent hydrolase [Legionella oakridgensis]|nr:putative transposase [Legionella longbeachae D-4968]VEE04096.1 membrane-associated, metal-dependent hydrolase [Legionella oakridgensis]
MAFKLTQSITDDRTVVSELAKGLMGKLIGDKAYISPSLFDDLFVRGVQLITKKNMKNKLMPIFEKYLLRKRVIVETVIDQLKNISQIEHFRYRSIANFMVNIVAGLSAYSLQPKKLSLKFMQLNG